MFSPSLLYLNNLRLKGNKAVLWKQMKDSYISYETEYFLYSVFSIK